MKTLAFEPKIIAMANALHLDGTNPVESLIQFCRQRITNIFEEHGEVHTIVELEHLVCEYLNLTIEEVWTEDQLDEVARNYVSAGEPVFAALRGQLDEDTYGMLIRRRTLSPGGEIQYVAIIDCRGEKATRRFFTRWHEIVHALTAFDQYELPLRRTSITAIAKDPIEKLTDMIAGDLGFFDPLFGPVLKAEVRAARRLTFDVVENIRARFSSDASFQATLNACVAHWPSPIVLVEAGLGLKAEEVRAVNSPQGVLFASPKPKACLRILNAVPNEAARRALLQVHRNMRVPPSSIISKVFTSDAGEEYGAAQSIENLSAWTCSDGSRLSAREVRIQVKKAYDRVLAIIAPLILEDRASKRRKLSDVNTE